MSERFGKEGEKKKILKNLIKKLHNGTPVQEIKKDFKELIRGTTPSEISQIEEELIKEGFPREELHTLCDIHIELFKESLDKEKALAPPGHPINILMEEHKLLLNYAGDLKKIASSLKEYKFSRLTEDQLNQLIHIEKHMKSSESHYVREENVLFPYLEKHGVTQPPAIMWMEHDQIREIKKKLYGLIEGNKRDNLEEFSHDLNEISISLAEMLSSHFYKENNILFQAALKVISDSEWKEIRKQFDDLGYCCFTPKPEKMEVEEKKEEPLEVKMEGLIQFESGSLTAEELESTLNALPVDITFIDKEDTVRYFSMSKERIFPRAKAVIGRKVQQCHPEKSLHVVNKILEDFRSGKRDKAEFWINMNDRLILIRYFPVRNKNDTYLGCLEVTQDITDIKTIEGEKRLL